MAWSPQDIQLGHHLTWAGQPLVFPHLGIEQNDDLEIGWCAREWESHLKNKHQEPHISRVQNLDLCYRLHVSPLPAASPQPIQMFKPNLQPNCVRRRGLWKVTRSWGEPLWMRLVPLSKRPRRAPLPFLPRENTTKRQLWTRKWVLTRHLTCQHLELELPDLQNCEE